MKADTVVATIVSNPALDRFLEGIGVKCVRSAVGERYVIEEMKNAAAISAAKNPAIWLLPTMPKPVIR